MEETNSSDPVAFKVEEIEYNADSMETILNEEVNFYNICFYSFEYT